MIALTIDREEEAAPFMFLNNPYMVSSSHNAVNRSCRVAVVRLESRVATRPVFDKRCLWGGVGKSASVQERSRMVWERINPRTYSHTCLSNSREHITTQKQSEQKGKGGKYYTHSIIAVKYKAAGIINWRLCEEKFEDAATFDCHRFSASVSSSVSLKVE